MADEKGPPTSKRTKSQKNVLIGVTGSVASIKLSKLVDELLLLQPKVQCRFSHCEMTNHFFHFHVVFCQLLHKLIVLYNHIGLNSVCFFNTARVSAQVILWRTRYFPCVMSD